MEIWDLCWALNWIYYLSSSFSNNYKHTVYIISHCLRIKQCCTTFGSAFLKCCRSATLLTGIQLHIVQWRWFESCWNGVNKASEPRQHGYSWLDLTSCIWLIYLWLLTVRVTLGLDSILWQSLLWVKCHCALVAGSEAGDLYKVSDVDRESGFVCPVSSVWATGGHCTARCWMPRVQALFFFVTCFSTPAAALAEQ